MSEHVYKKIEITGSSKKSVEDAIQTAIAKASRTVHNMRWFEVIDTRGYIEGSEISYYQVTIKIGFTVD
jgi:flavin-binding protein dodecin